MHDFLVKIEPGLVNLTLTVLSLAGVIITALTKLYLDKKGVKEEAETVHHEIAAESERVALVTQKAKLATGATEREAQRLAKSGQPLTSEEKKTMASDKLDAMLKVDVPVALKDSAIEANVPEKADGG